MTEMSVAEDVVRVPEARYAYYRRCQVFRRNAEQCKAPAEKGSHICYAHASQLAMAVRRERERRAVLAEAVAEMRRRGKPECEMADLFTDFKGIQVTLAVMSRAVITGRIDCKTAGQMVVQLQTFSKLLWQIHRKGRKGRKDLPLIHTDNTDLKKMPELKPLPRMNADLKKLPKPGALQRMDADDADVITESWGHLPHQAKTGLVGDPGGEKQGLPQICADKRRLKSENWTARSPVRRAPDCGGAKVLQFEGAAFKDRSWAHGPPESKAA